MLVSTMISRSRFASHLRPYKSNNRHISGNETHPQWSPPSDGFETGINIYNCVTRQKVPVVLQRKNWATWYSCGPTVYDASHIGHASCYVKQDILQRILRQHFGINLVTAMNITDVDDKIITKALATGQPWHELVESQEDSFWKDMTRLGCSRPDYVLRVTEHMPQIIRFIGKLMAEGFAYGLDDGSVYFDVGKLKTYGKLQTINQEETEHKWKRSALDFALWKGRSKDNNPKEPHWPTPWSTVGGRPGWHIECSAMASHLFGENIDFHSGGLDLRFPHHENEEAQSCAHHKCNQWVNYWIHIGQLHIVGEEHKMSKSLNNTIGITQFLESHSASEFRMYCLLSHYQHRMDYSEGSMQAAQSVLKRLRNFSDDCAAYVGGSKPVGSFTADSIQTKLADATLRIDAALRDNFATAKTIETLLDVVKHCNRLFSSSGSEAAPLLVSASSDLGAVLAVDSFIARHTRMFGLENQPATPMPDDDDGSPKPSCNKQFDRLVHQLLDLRSTIRQRAVDDKNKSLFVVSDNIRDILKQSGISVKDR